MRATVHELHASQEPFFTQLGLTPDCPLWSDLWLELNSFSVDPESSERRHQSSASSKELVDTEVLTFLRSKGAELFSDRHFCVGALCHAPTYDPECSLDKYLG